VDNCDRLLAIITREEYIGGGGGAKNLKLVEDKRGEPERSSEYIGTARVMLTYLTAPSTRLADSNDG